MTSNIPVVGPAVGEANAPTPHTNVAAVRLYGRHNLKGIGAGGRVGRAAVLVAGRVHRHRCGITHKTRSDPLSGAHATLTRGMTT